MGFIALGASAIAVGLEVVYRRWTKRGEMYHILYTTIEGDFVSEDKEFPSFAAAEHWLCAIGAPSWDISLSAKECKHGD